MTDGLASFGLNARTNAATYGATRLFHALQNSEIRTLLNDEQTSKAKRGALSPRSLRGDLPPSNVELEGPGGSTWAGVLCCLMPCLEPPALHARTKRPRSSRQSACRQRLSTVQQRLHLRTDYSLTALKYLRTGAQFSRRWKN